MLWKNFMLFHETKKQFICCCLQMISYPILRMTYLSNGMFSQVNIRRKYLLDLFEKRMKFQSKMHSAKSLWIYVNGSEFLGGRHEECQELAYV